MLPPGESRQVYQWDRQTDKRQTVTLHFPLDADGKITGDCCLDEANYGNHSLKRGSFIVS